MKNPEKGMLPVIASAPKCALDADDVEPGTSCPVKNAVVLRWSKAMDIIGDQSDLARTLFPFSPSNVVRGCVIKRDFEWRLFPQLLHSVSVSSDGLPRQSLTMVMRCSIVECRA